MGLKEYRLKRDFSQTSEPAGDPEAVATESPAQQAKQGAPNPAAGHAYVIQKHDASRLHYDFRLQLGGVLKSWAVPKGPSLDPHDKRLAIEVEDHPLEYGDFEGSIPEGQYGGGTVMLWDRGWWEPIEDPEAGYRKGSLKFNLHGDKLQGSWALVRLARSDRDKPQWLLIKHRDDAARPSGEFDVTAAEPLSVATGRTMEEIAAGKPAKKRGSRIKRDAVWSTNRDADTSDSKPAAPISKAPQKPHSDRGTAVAKKPAAQSPPLKIARRGDDPMPRSIEPQLATLVAQAPDGNQWIHEIKFDGYRIIAYIDGAHVRLRTRNDLDWTKKLGPLETAARAIKATCILDGEIVVFDDRGASQFQLLQNSFRLGRVDKIVYVVFDLLYLAGEDLRPRPLDERKQLLQSLGLLTDRGPIRYADHIVGHGPEFYEAVTKQDLEGIISKRRDRPYVGGRTTDWLKLKGQQHAEFVIGGYTDPSGAREKFGALLLGYHEDGKLIYAGRVGTGFTQKTLATVLTQLEPLAQGKSPFADFPGKARPPKGVHWVAPQKVAQITFSRWTDDNQLRHPSFQSLREDKPAAAVTREYAKPIETLPAATNGKAKRSSRGAKTTKQRPAVHSTTDSAKPTPSPSTERDPQEIEIDGVRVSHPARVFWPDENITKRELAEFYAEHAGLIVPHLVDRPLSIVRCPGGLNGPRFFQKHLGDSAPSELGQFEIEEKGGAGVYSYVKDAGSLIALAQIAALEIHPWGSRIDKVELPDRLIFDLDPAPDVAWSAVIDGARAVREFLKQLGLESFVKTSGNKGLHLVVPIQRKQEWPDVEAFCELVARGIATAAPDRYVANMSKAKRVGKIYVDYLRNRRGATAVAPYGTRALPGAPISLPIDWKELPRTSGGGEFHLREVAKRLRRQRRDPWADIGAIKQSITAKMIKTLGG